MVRNVDPWSNRSTLETKCPPTRGSRSRTFAHAASPMKKDVKNVPNRRLSLLPRTRERTGSVGSCSPQAPRPSLPMCSECL
ncbi:hypothetical protein MPTK1_2g17970 [Marchantia polymorpha subsp. ruderalis]|uniref:Uncharacterized protein n=1 Tax=Marchantia polymorpha TaxID=3197 RepID=A0A2R6WGC4_MARPO|nr:hypothetical protein MARPO_0094s0065 [Marchantia polymorpha]BBN02769.1 hypothetical protein Mp_2g17970 [Marchantia polymorpha subsp. ruderalis]|eukprot:PTQ32896.1 hypothetical protein MARPO_0094s0065 [Marchantia polymorpha]